LAKLDNQVAIDTMLGWYRSSDLCKVTMAAHYFIHSDYHQEVDRLIDQLRSPNDDVVEAAKVRLAEIGHPACKKLLGLTTVRLKVE
jgi:hypothetical protein